MEDIFLVLHDNVTINNKQLLLAIKAGITKVNISNDLRKVYLKSLKKNLKTNPHLSDIKFLSENAILLFRNLLKKK